MLPIQRLQCQLGCNQLNVPCNLITVEALYQDQDHGTGDGHLAGAQAEDRSRLEEFRHRPREVSARIPDQSDAQEGKLVGQQRVSDPALLQPVLACQVTS